MLEDEEVAKSFLSAIIEEDVLEVHFAAQERTLRRPLNEVAAKEGKKYTEKLFLTVCRFDLSAKIATPNGEHKTVLIELQKAKFSTDIMRFRCYIDSHYQSLDNTYDSGNHQKARQIYSIFLLGYNIGIRDCPIIQVDQNIKDGMTKKNLEVTNEFIESSHRFWIVQLDQLKQHCRNNAEKLLSIFDWDNYTATRYILKVDENDFPKRYIPIIRRLRIASESADVLTEMEMEDDYIKVLQDKERIIAEKDKTIEEKDRTIEEKDRLIKESQEKLAKSQM
jgi:hypothetical protein